MLARLPLLALYLLLQVWWSLDLGLPDPALIGRGHDLAKLAAGPFMPDFAAFVYVTAVRTTKRKREREYRE